MHPTTWERTVCRVCGAGGLARVLSLGEMPPANALRAPAELTNPEVRFPLALALCEACGMVQLGHVVSPELLFRSYLFVTSSSQRMSEHFSALMAAAVDEHVPASGGLVVEIGSNDGTGLSSIKRRDVRVLGVDPARNIAVLAAAREVPTIPEFFTEALAAEIVRTAGAASLVVACNVLGHIDDLHDVCRGIRTLLAPRGALVFEVPYLQDLVDLSAYDAIYHEHLSYFAVRPLVKLLNENGLRLERVEFFPVHGGTLRGTAVHGRGCAPAVEAVLSKELETGLARRATFDAMATRVEDHRRGLRTALTELRERRIKIAGYGAPAKGTVVLNHCGLGVDLLPFVVDSTPAKQGLHVPGTHQLIRPPSVLADEKPDVLLLLAWNHAGEIREREAAFLARGGRFLLPHSPASWCEPPAQSASR